MCLWCMCVNTCAVYMCMHVLIHVMARGWCWHVYFHYSQPYIWKTDYLEFAIRIQFGGWSVSPGILSFLPFAFLCCWGIREMYYLFFFYVCTGDLNLDFHASKASTLPTKPCSQDWRLNFMLECCKPHKYSLSLRGMLYRCWRVRGPISCKKKNLHCSVLTVE